MTRLPRVAASGCLLGASDAGEAFSPGDPVVPEGPMTWHIARVVCQIGPIVLVEYCRINGAALIGHKAFVRSWRIRRV